MTTYGKAIHQKFLTLPSGGVQMTVAHYTTPVLKPIEATRIRPDVVMKQGLQLFGAPTLGEKKAA